MIDMGLPYQTILDGDNMGQFWEYLKFFMFFIAPVVMIWVAIQLVGWVVRMIRGTVTEEDTRRRRYDDDDDDYYYY